MALDDKHPEYVKRLPQWQKVSDCYEGEEQVKSEAATYLPPTSSMRAKGYGKNTNSSGQQAYDAYILRALFHEFFYDSVIGMMGAIHRKPPSFKVPASLEPVVEKATARGESLTDLWRKITEQQLVPGRQGLLVDVPSGRTGEVKPYIAQYSAETIINWDVGDPEEGEEDIELVVLDESGFKRAADFSWKFVRKYRVLTRAAQAAATGAEDQRAPAAGTYVVAVVSEDGAGLLDGDVAKAAFVAPSLAGRTLERIPFVFLNVNDLAPEPDRPCLIGLARLALAIYRGEADYRQTLYLQGQATVVRIGATKEQQKIQVGAGAVLDVDVGGDAKYITPPSDGLEEQRMALENDKKQASSFTMQFLANEAGAGDQSGSALRIRVAGRTTTLASVQRAAAAAIREALIHCGRFQGLSEEVLQAIEVTPNMEFADEVAEPGAPSQIMDAKQKGAPLCRESIHAWLKRKGFTTMEFEEELERILEEDAALGTLGGTDTDMDDPEDEEEDDPPPPRKAPRRAPAKQPAKRPARAAR